ncbi:MAG: universal stress protein [Desulfobacula sp.]|jgi:nucleotide-binding universal stress UspA family protein|nr:universal stress protein [Desulfobacula sp.]
MFEKILFPTDFSTMAAKAFDYVKKLKQAGTKEVVLLNVINQRMIDSIGLICSSHYAFDEATGAYVGDVEEILDKIMQERIQKTNKLKSELEECGLQVKVLIKKGFPISELLAIEKEEKVSAIVIGSHGRKNLPKIFLGDVSEKVIRRCKSPVLVIKR